MLDLGGVGATLVDPVAVVDVPVPDALVVVSGRVEHGAQGEDVVSTLLVELEHVHRVVRLDETDIWVSSELLSHKLSSFNLSNNY